MGTKITALGIQLERLDLLELRDRRTGRGNAVLGQTEGDENRPPAHQESCTKGAVKKSHAQPAVASALIGAIGVLSAAYQTMGQRTVPRIAYGEPSNNGNCRALDGGRAGRKSGARGAAGPQPGRDFAAGLQA